MRASVSLIFPGTCYEAFQLYRSIFGGSFTEITKYTTSSITPKKNTTNTTTTTTTTATPTSNNNNNNTNNNDDNDDKEQKQEQQKEQVSVAGGDVDGGGVNNKTEEESESTTITANTNTAANANTTTETTATAATVVDNVGGGVIELKSKIMRICLPIINMDLLGCDYNPTVHYETTSSSYNVGNNIEIIIQPDTKDEADNIFNAFCNHGGTIKRSIDYAIPQQQQQETETTATTLPTTISTTKYYGKVIDKFGIRWMIEYDGDDDTKDAQMQRTIKNIQGTLKELEYMISPPVPKKPRLSADLITLKPVRHKFKEARENRDIILDHMNNGNHHPVLIARDRDRRNHCLVCCTKCNPDKAKGFEVHRYRKGYKTRFGCKECYLLQEQKRAEAEGIIFDRNNLTDAQKNGVVWLCAGEECARGFPGRDGKASCWDIWHAASEELPTLMCGALFETTTTNAAAAAATKGTTTSETATTTTTPAAGGETAKEFTDSKPSATKTGQDDMDSNEAEV